MTEVTDWKLPEVRNFLNNNAEKILRDMNKAQARGLPSFKVDFPAWLLPDRDDVNAAALVVAHITGASPNRVTLWIDFHIHQRSLWEAIINTPPKILTYQQVPPHMWENLPADGLAMLDRVYFIITL